MGPLTRVAAAAAVLAAGAVAGVLVLGRDARAPAVPTSAPLTVRATITPPISGFGDRLVARVAVLVDPRVVDSRRVRVSENLAPLTPLGPLRARRSAGAVTIELPVSCLAADCTSDGGARSVDLPAGGGRHDRAPVRRTVRCEYVVSARIENWRRCVRRRGFDCLVTNAD